MMRDKIVANLIFVSLHLLSHFEITLNRQELGFINYLDINFSSCCHLIRLRVEFFEIINAFFFNYSILDFV